MARRHSPSFLPPLGPLAWRTARLLINSEHYIITKVETIQESYTFLRTKGFAGLDLLQSGEPRWHFPAHNSKA